MGRKSIIWMTPLHSVEPSAFSQGFFLFILRPRLAAPFHDCFSSLDSILLRSLRYSDLPFSHVNSWWTLLGQSTPFCPRTLSFFHPFSLFPLPCPTPSLTPLSPSINLLTHLLSVTLWASSPATRLHSHINMYAPSFVSLLHLSLFSHPLYHPSLSHPTKRFDFSDFLVNLCFLVHICLTDYGVLIGSLLCTRNT